MFYNQILNMLERRYLCCAASVSRSHYRLQTSARRNQIHGSGEPKSSGLDVAANRKHRLLARFRKTKTTCGFFGLVNAQELSAECNEAASKIQDASLKKINQQNSRALENAVLIKSYNEDVALLNSIEWDLYESINTRFDAAISRLKASETRFRNAGYGKDADEVYHIVTEAYEKKGEALFNISGDVYGVITGNLLRASLDAYKTALLRVKRPSTKTVLTSPPSRRRAQRHVAS